jgi:hypothetical protein
MVTITVGLPGRCSQPVALQESIVQGLPSSQFSGGPLWQTPVAGLHDSVVQAFPSSQFSGVPVQAPPMHRSELVHWFPSLHESLLFKWVQVPVASQLSEVQGLPSSQLLFRWMQAPVAGMHASFVQALPSSQFIGVPTHRGPEPVTVQRSLVVHALPSSQGRVSGAPGTQIPELQWSNMVQGFPSSHEAVL